MTITLEPSVLAWARDRARLSREDLARAVGVKVEKVEAWEAAGELTWKQAEKLATATRTAFGYLFLPEPPAESLPIPDFRTVGSRPAPRPSPDLLDVLHQSLRRQEWFRDYLVAEEHEPLGFIGSAALQTDPVRLAATIRRQLGFHPSQSTEHTLDGVLGEFTEAVEAAGILVVRAGIVGNNTHRPLDPEEFRGFALVDEYAPLVFVNAADFKGAQIFTLAHELAHLWIGQSALFNLEGTYAPAGQELETYCNAVAAEYLVPLEDLRQRVAASPAPPDELVEAMRQHYRVSDLVMIRRLRDLGLIDAARFKAWYEDRLGTWREAPAATGGDFYRNQPNRVGRRFAQALIASTLEGRTLVRDALSLLGFSKVENLHRLASELKLSASFLRDYAA